MAPEHGGHRLVEDVAGHASSPHERPVDVPQHQSSHGDILSTIRSSKALADDTAASLKTALTDFGRQFA